MTAGNVAVMASLATVCETLTVYVPVVPVPVPSAVIYVFAVTPDPAITLPTPSVPEATALTVSVVPEIAPVNEASAPPEMPSAAPMISAALD